MKLHCNVGRESCNVVREANPFRNPYLVSDVESAENSVVKNGEKWDSLLRQEVIILGPEKKRWRSAIGVEVCWKKVRVLLDGLK